MFVMAMPLAYRSGRAPAISSRLGELDRGARLLQPPQKPDDEVSLVVHERGLLPFEVVTDELKAPSHREHRRGERQADDGGAHGEAGGDERDAHAVTRLVARIGVVLGYRVIRSVHSAFSPNHMGRFSVLCPRRTAHGASMRASNPDRM